MRGGTTPFDYIIRRTFLRPREVLNFVSLCLDEAGQDALTVGNEHVRKAEGTYSTWKVEDLKQEYRKAIPNSKPLLEALRQQTHRYDTFQDLETVLRAKAPRWWSLVGKGVALICCSTPRSSASGLG